MLVKNDKSGKPFGLGRADIILAQSFQQRRPGRTDHIGHHDQSEVHGRQHEHVEPLAHISHIRVADHRKPPQVDGKGQQQQDAGIKGWKREPQEGHDADPIVCRTVPENGRENTQWETQKDSHQNACKGQLDRIRQYFCDHAVDGLLTND